VVEDEGILSADEMDRAVTRGPGNMTGYTDRWSKSFFVRELPDGNILNVIVVLLPEARENSSVWVIAGRDGEILARSEVKIPYEVWNDTSDGHYLASYWDAEALEHVVVKLEVTIDPS